MSVEFEMPLVSLIFILMIMIVYFSKKKIRLTENKYYEVILVGAFIEAFMDFIAHFICATNDFETITNGIYIDVFNWLNRILVVSFSTVISSLFVYILIISYEKLRNKEKYINMLLIVFNFWIFIGTLFGNVELVQVGSVTNVTGWITSFGYCAIAFLLFLSTILTFANLKKFDKRYISLFMIIILLICFYVMTIYFPGLIIYDLILAVLCYIMYFTIENPDVKMLEDVTIAKNNAEKANRAKTDFLSSMSHEIRTPLNAIVGFSECILEEQDINKAKEDAKDIIMASQNLLEIVNGILDISKIEADKMELIDSEYSLVDNMSNIAKLMIPRIGEKPIVLKTKFAPDIPNCLYGDIGKIKQIVTNLLTNAVKYTDKGIINFEINCLNEKDICTIIVSVEDTGRGIKPEKIDSIFNKFERLEEDRNTTLEGTGLGLAITKRLAEMMGGKVVVQSKYGSGSKFTVYLKQKIVNKQVIVKESNIDSNEKFDCSGKRILVVDDNKINIKVALRLLEPYKVYITTCESGIDCIDLVNKEKFDLILLDDMMPKLTGKETLTKLKEIRDFNVPVVALTANAIEGMKEEYLKLGFDDYLSKPIDKLELERVLRKTLGNNSDVMKNTFEPLPDDLFNMNIPLK